MREIWIKDADLAGYEKELCFEDDLPVIAAYRRVSSDAQVDEGHSLSTQERYIRDDCLKRFGDSCAIIWVTDAGNSRLMHFIMPLP